MKTLLTIIFAASVASADWCHVTDKAWNPRPLPANYGQWGVGYDTVVPDAQHYADGWRVAVPAEPRTGFKISSSHPEFTLAQARQVVDVWIDEAAQAKADADAVKAAEAAEDARIMALPSIVALIAENTALKVAAKEQAIRQAAELDALTKALEAARGDAEAVAVAVKEWAIKEKGEKDSAATAASAEVPK